ncbi:MAG: PA2169 family four-helix-bundle protein [Saprospiraceae bacterium]|nr:PA2169 family four-helix-bundle protein [Saprospiraceae bacterium]
MQNNEELVDALNELVRINYDRVFGYELAIEDVENTDVDLKAVFSKYADQSREYVTHWQQTITSLGGEPVADSTVRGKLFRVWMDFKATLTGKSRQSMLDSCEFGEGAAQRAYQEALETDAHLPDNIRQEIAEQKAELKSSHDSIRDAARLHDQMN